MMGSYMQLHKNIQEKHRTILLISLAYSFGERLEKETRNIQIGILYLGTVLKNNGYRVKLLYSDYPDIESIVEKVKKERVFIVGFYTNTDNIYRCIRCARVLKRTFSDIIIIMGGPHATVMDMDILEREESIDLIVRGEGENILLEIVRFYFEGYGKLKNIKGITYREKEKKFSNSSASFIDDLDSLPLPDIDLLEDEQLKMTSILYPRIITGRGCPFKCAFCHEGFHGGTYRIRSATNVLQEVDYYLNKGKVRYILFLDDTFTVNPRRTIEICRGLRERSKEGTNFVWFAEGRVDLLARYPRLIYEMSLAGLAILQLGVECSEEKVLNLYQKNITLEQIEKVVTCCVDAMLPGISINFIIGGPMESIGLYEKNLDFIRKLMKIAPGMINVSATLLAPYPGTRIMKYPEKFGLKIIDSECKTGLSHKTCFCESEYLNEYELTNLRENFDRAVREIMLEVSKEITPAIIETNFALKSFGINTTWLDFFSGDIGIKRFFDLKYYESIISPCQVKEEDFLKYYPIRSYPLRYNDENLLLLDKFYGQKTLDKIDTALYDLSSGKRNVEEILKLAEENIFKGLRSDEIYKRIKDFYKRMEDLHAIIFARV